MAPVQGLRVFASHKRAEVELPPGDIRYTIVSEVIELAMNLMESPAGRFSLVDVGTNTVKAFNDAKPPTNHLYQRPLSDMGWCIDEFLGHVRACFPLVYLNTLQEEAMVQRTSWGSNVSTFDPQIAAWLELHATIIANMVSALERKDEAVRHAYRMFKFQMAISAGHEQCHLVGYLTGNAEVKTPPKLAMAGSTDATFADSGRDWDRKLLGSVVDFFQEKDIVLQTKQAGTSHRLHDGTRGCPARRIFGA